MILDLAVSFNKLYYSIKPLVPASIRRGVRRWFALKKRAQMQNVWPILPGSERQPEGWRGWPDGKKFAFVLTHDVEGPGGLAKCRQLMEVEKKWGFRSSFNFIPEGDYTADRELREELARDGFEVGIHDLHHDGKLYRSREAFAQYAARINHYIKEWGADGFRAGFMFHNLDWQTDLEILYDASTFDTDPFEPQPDGAGTIFPFWKECPNGRGFVELPYTLPQDSTLFLLFRETTPAIWIEKLDWVARHGGMALINVHPDYLDYDSTALSEGKFPASWYAQLLEHVATRYPGKYWSCLPRELAVWYTGTMVPSRRRQAPVP